MLEKQRGRGEWRDIEADKVHCRSTWSLSAFSVGCRRQQISHGRSFVQQFSQPLLEVE